MQESRMLGNYVSELAEKNNMSVSDLSKILDCSEKQVYSFIKGRSYASFKQLSGLAKTFNTTVGELLKGDKKTYDENVVHCMGPFNDTDNREKILDIIDDYIDIVDALNM